MNFLKTSYHFFLSMAQGRNFITNTIIMTINIVMINKYHNNFFIVLALIFGYFSLLNLLALIFSIKNNSYCIDTIINKNGNIYFGNNILFTGKKNIINLIHKSMHYKTINNIQTLPSKEEHYLGYNDNLKYKKNISVYNFILNELIGKIALIILILVIYGANIKADIENSPVDYIGFVLVGTVSLLYLLSKLFETKNIIKLTYLRYQKEDLIRSFYNIKNVSKIKVIINDNVNPYSVVGNYSVILGICLGNIAIINRQVYKNGELTTITYDMIMDYLENNNIYLDDLKLCDIDLMEMINIS